MRCTTHRREFDGACNWCGKKLCDYCVAKNDGKKIYCEHCAVALIPYKRQKLPMPKTREAEVVPAQEVPSVKRKFVLGQDGYYELR